MNTTDSLLVHIKGHCLDIRDFIAGLSEAEFICNKLVRNAVGMSLINIGELVKALPQEFCEEHPQLPWRRIAGMRDLAAHNTKAWICPQCGMWRKTASLRFWISLSAWN